MNSTVEDGLRILREATEQAAQIRIELTDDYLAPIAQVEAMAQNQAGADKSGRWRGSLPDMKANLSRVRLKSRDP